MSNSFDSIWEDIYSKGKHLNLYPFDAVVSFLFTKQLRNTPRNQQNIIEVGCGAGNNLWFAAREGFNVSGIDASISAISFAKHRFKQEKLLGNFSVGNFVELPYESDFFNFAIDRCAITHSNKSSIYKAVGEIYRVLKKEGLFLFCAFADSHSSASSGIYNKKSETIENIMAGSLTGVGQVNFLTFSDISDLFQNPKWEIIQLNLVESTDLKQPANNIQAEWRVIIKKV